MNVLPKAHRRFLLWRGLLGTLAIGVMLGLYLYDGSQVGTTPEPALDARVPLPRPSPVKKDIRALTRVIYAEARDQSYEGQVGVGQVVLNRAKESGKSIYDVVHEKTVRRGKVLRREFSGITDKPDENFLHTDFFAWRTADYIAVGMVAGTIAATGPVARATSYLNPEDSGIKGRCWFEKQVFLVKIDDHYFHDQPRTAVEQKESDTRKLSDDCREHRLVPLPRPRPKLLIEAALKSS